MFRQIGPLEIFLIIFVVVLLFGAKKLPELARGSGQALRIFKAETKALSEDDDKKTPEQRDIDARNESTSYEAPPPKPTANPNDQGEPERRTDTPG